MVSETLTRAERQARTREALVATAKDLFLDVGYAATSLDRVAEAAGFSKGAVYSNFRHKDELCLAVLDDIHARQLAQVVAAFEVDGSLDKRLAAFEAWAEDNLGEPRWTALEVEFATRARHSEFVAAALRDRNQAVRDAIAHLVSDSAERFGLVPAMSADDVATALLSLGIGLGVARSNNPALPIDVMSRTIRLLLAGGRG
jgi:AcrR family transcriptional regulator